MSPLDGFGAALRALRDRARLRQEDLAEKVGVSRGMIGRYETEKKRPGLETLGRMLAALDADLFDLGREARKASGRAVPEEDHGGGADFTPDQLRRLDEEAHLTAMSLTVRHLRTLRGQAEPDPEGLDP